MLESKLDLLAVRIECLNETLRRR